MDDPATHSVERAPTAHAAGWQLGRLRRLVLKELREILRDRRTIITLVVMPILIYPLLAVVFQRFLLTSISVHQDVEYAIGIDSEIAGKMLAKQLQLGSSVLDEQRGNVSPNHDTEPMVTFHEMPADELGRYVADSTLHLAVLLQRESGERAEQGLRTPTRWQLLYRAGSPTSEAALHYVEMRLHAYSEAGLNEQLKKLGVAASLPAATERRPIEFTSAPNFSLAALIPLILVLMTVTGAVYPAIDLTAGERERGTLETLIAAPVPRLGLLLAKYVAVLTVALLTALVNLIGMTITAHSSGLAASLFGGSLNFDTLVKVLLLLALFAAFFSAILLALTSYARSFKEAQAYIIPLMLLCLVPGILCLLPGLEFKPWMAVTPLVNIVMLARDMLEGTVLKSLAIAAVCSTLFYIAAAIALAARIFGTDAILYGSPATWSDLVRRPESPQPAPTFPAAMLGLALMFPSYFVLSNGLVRSQELAMGQRLVLCAVITVAVFGGIPIGIALAGRVSARSGFGLRAAGIGSFISAVLLGLSLWPAAHEVALGSEWLGMLKLSREQIAMVETMFRQFQTVSLWLVLATLAIVPAVCEELCFRGFLFSALRTRLNGGWTVCVTAALFGVFHELLFPGKLLQSTFLGLVLGWVRLRTRSVLPGIVLHAVFNSLLLTVMYYRDALAARGWGVAEESHLPFTWHAAATLGVICGFGLLLAAKPRQETRVAGQALSEIA